MAQPPLQTAARPRADPEMARVIASAADQVRRCYRAPRVGRAGGSIVTTLRVNYAPDGTLAELPRLLGQRGVTEANAYVAQQLAEAATLAIIRCAPISLPPERYSNGWDSFDLTFSPKAVA
ncbi:hypothetical protein [Sphingomonas profundi]|uniref:hypothetical protein n=1 Tax=Alterirhizorhabdus profundi TaxID=2681549 RepID=UPI0012E93169|nr:hypothetical protein [Sphingomonas profundi]